MHLRKPSLRHESRGTVRGAARLRRGLVAATVVAAAVAGTLGVVNIGVASASLTGTLSVPAQSPNPVSPGGTTTYSPISVTRTSNTPLFAKLTVTGLPTGAAYDDSGDGCVAVSSNTFTFSALTVTTVTGMSGGSNTFTVTATGYSN